MMPKFDDYFTDDNNFLHCPECGFNYVHIQQPVLIDGEDSYATGLGNRGDAITIKCTCEQGCEFLLLILFHKGNTRLVCRTADGKYTNAHIGEM